METRGVPCSSSTSTSQVMVAESAAATRANTHRAVPDEENVALPTETGRSTTSASMPESARAASINPSTASIRAGLGEDGIAAA